MPGTTAGHSAYPALAGDSTRARACNRDPLNIDSSEIERLSENTEQKPIPDRKSVENIIFVILPFSKPPGGGNDPYLRIMTYQSSEEESPHVSLLIFSDLLTLRAPQLEYENSQTSFSYHQDQVHQSTQSKHLNFLSIWAASDIS